MKLIDDLINRVQRFNDGLTSGTIIKEIILENEAFIIDMNAEQQLFEQGINALGVHIADYAPYSPITIEIKRQKGQPTNRVTLRDEGDFHSSFYVVAGDEQFEIKAGDWKTEKLMQLYGDEILGLTNENIQDLITDIMKPALLTEAKLIIYGKR